MFKNLTLYRLLPDYQYDAATLNQALSATPLRDCGQIERMTRGWVPFDESLRSISGFDCVVSVEHQLFVKLGVQEKVLPASVVKKQLAERIEALTATQGYAPGRRQQRELKEQIEVELLPRAFSKQRTTNVWIDPVRHWLAIEGGSAVRADEVVEQIRLTLGAVPLAPLRTRNSLGGALTAWVASGDAPENFTIDRNAELKSNIEGKSSVRYVNRSLDNPEIRENISSGMTVAKLAMTWRNRLSFVISDDFRLRKLTLHDISIMDPTTNTGGQSVEEIFQAEAVLWTGEVAELLGGLVQALGGEELPAQ